MIREMAEAVRPAPLPVVDIRIRVHRDGRRVQVEDAEIHVPAEARRADDRPRVRWCLDGDLLADELVLVHGRPLDWTGPSLRRVRGLRLVEGAFPQPFLLTRQQPRVLSGPVRDVFPDDVGEVGWSFGAVLVRGDDTPWVGSSLLRLVRDRS
ncbi:MAG TPA: hypothetical protein VKA86_04210 [Candidatus Krumholzibacteria bacterium]|nr:hypothetical protein [Candidatus Krumholzibacteria bacterium]